MTASRSSCRPGAAAAGYADEAVLLADGRIVDRIKAPSPASVIGRITALGA